MTTNHQGEGKVYEVKMARTLGPTSIIFIGIGSLLGGGIFSLLGPTINLVGPGLFLSMILGAFIAFLNLQMYVALGTTFPEAGGGYLWVRKGLGNFQGFFAGWLSWFAHAAACGVYALSFGYYAIWLLEMYHINFFATSGFFSGEKMAALIMIIIFGYINWRGTKTTGSTGNYITVILLAILAGYVYFGLKQMTGMTNPFVNFHPFLPNGIVGVFAATCFYYIAFEGSEIQVQAGEETKNPAHDIKIGLFTSWAVVSSIYIILSIIIIGATTSSGIPVWKMLGGFKEGAIVESARLFMPFGAVVLAVGGLFANLAALNTTIFSSSHVVFALARDKNFWRRLSQIHTKNFTPHFAVVVSVILISIMVLTLPLFDVASAASLLFVLLFLQLNIAGIVIHYKYPKTKWNYKIPMFPLIPILATFLYFLLALTMLNVNPVAWIVTIFWSLIGMVNYFSYAQDQGRESFEEDVVYEQTMRVVPKTENRILMPIPPQITAEELKNLSEIGFALASRYGGEILAVKVHTVPQVLTLLDGATMIHDQHIFELLKQWVQEFNRKMVNEKDINLHSLSMVGRDTVDSLLEVIKMEDCDKLLVSWDGFTKTKGVVFGSKIDRILRETKIDLLLVKNPQPVRSILLAEEYHGDNPYLPLTAEVLSALKVHFRPKMKLLSVIPMEHAGPGINTTKKLLDAVECKESDFEEIKILRAKSVVMAIVKEANFQKEGKLVIINASAPHILDQIRMGNIPELLAKHVDASVMIVRGHQGRVEVAFDKIIKFFK
ncbi:MAG: amino acid permease [Candidatus Paceibacterota bacterium]|jgi:amino acid transporter/nucleotide-binding universal stress UspA family protein